MRGARWGCRSAALAAFAVELLRADHLRRVLRFIVGCDFAADDLAVERKRLQHDVEAALVLVWKHEADVEPLVVLALAFDHGIGAVRRLARFFVRHGNTPSRYLRCPA